jgi:hypothetical protein
MFVFSFNVISTKVEIQFAMPFVNKELCFRLKSFEDGRNFLGLEFIESVIDCASVE